MSSESSSGEEKHNGGSGKTYYDSKVRDLATRAANDALGDDVGSNFPSLDAAAKAWAGAVRSVADKYHVEIGSKLFKVSGGYAFGSAVASGWICRDECSVNPNLGGDVGRVRVGDIHTHPGNRVRGFVFSEADLHSTYEDANGSGRASTGYVSLQNGQLWKFSSTQVDGTAGRRWEDYDKRAQLVK